MTLVVLLDSGPLGLVTNPRASAGGTECRQWLTPLLRSGVRVLVPEIADYEVRRELLRVGKIRGIARLNALTAEIATCHCPRPPCGRPPNSGLRHVDEVNRRQG